MVLVTRLMVCAGVRHSYVWSSVLSILTATPSHSHARTQHRLHVVVKREVRSPPFPLPLSRVKSVKADKRFVIVTHVCCEMTVRWRARSLSDFDKGTLF